jgi:hypothetical protein
MPRAPEGFFHEGSLTPVGPSVFGCGFGIPERACHRDLALLVSGFLATSGSLRPVFWSTLVSPHARRGMSTITTSSEWCAVGIC